MHHLPENQGDGGQLGDHGRNGHAQHPEPGKADQQDIKNDIQTAGGNQGIEGTAGVTDGPQHPGFHVVDGGKQDAGDVNLQIAVGISEDILRTADDTEQLPAENNPERCHGQADDQGKQQRGVNGIAQFIVVFGPERTGKQHGSAGGHAGEEADEQVGNGRAGVDGSQGRLADKVADDQRVHTVVQILKKIADKNRGGKLHDLQDNISFSEIHCAVSAHFPLPPMLFYYNIKLLQTGEFTTPEIVSAGFLTADAGNMLR